MKVGIVQPDVVVGDILHNTSQIVKHIAEAAADDCDVVVFPEMSDVGYDMTEVEKCAAARSDGATVRIAEAAKTHSIAVICGIAEREDGKLFNTVAVFDSQGNPLADYRKVHLITAEPICEQNYVTAGQSLCLFDLAGFRCGIITCYDVRFPEMARALAARGAEVLFVPAAFPESRIHHWNILTECRAIENQIYVAACNRTGTDAGIRFGGSSRIISPAGDIEASLDTDSQGMITGRLSHEAVRQVRDGLQVWRDRRTDLYNTWNA